MHMNHNRFFSHIVVRILVTLFGAVIGNLLLGVSVDMALRFTDFEFPINIVGLAGVAGSFLGGIVTWKKLKANIKD